MTAPVDRLRALPRDDRLAFYRSLPPGALAAVATDPRFWARPAQELPPVGQLAKVELVLGGRRAGKTLWATWLFLREWLSGRARMPRVIASTESAVLDTVIMGKSGLWTWLPMEWKAKVGHDPTRAFVVSKGHAGTFRLPGLPPVICLSAEKPGSATGQGKDLTLADDPAAWTKVCGEAKAKAMFREARISTSEGRNPCVIVPTTLDGIPFLRRALGGNMSGVRKRNLGSARDNTALAPSYIAEVIADMAAEGGDVSDLDGVERTKVDGALWDPAWIQRCRATPQLVRVVVAVDPADDAKADSDETGIVVAGLGEDGRLYVLADYTARWDAAMWPAIAAYAFREHQADALVAETNRAASLVRRCLAIEAPNVPLVEVQATRDKATRATPLAMQTRDGLVSFLSDGPQLCRPGHVWIRVPVFNPATGRRDVVDTEVRRDRYGWETLEAELCGWDPRRRRSPNGLDALVWACWHLKPADAPPAEWAPGSPAIEGRYAHVDPRATGSRLADFRARLRG